MLSVYFRNGGSLCHVWTSGGSYAKFVHIAEGSCVKSCVAGYAVFSVHNWIWLCQVCIAGGSCAI
jgi:hypothetical protein